MKKRFVIAFVMGLLGVGADVRAQKCDAGLFYCAQCGGCLTNGSSCPADCPQPQPVHDLPCASQLQFGVIYKIPLGKTFLCESGPPQKILSTMQNGQTIPEHYTCPSPLPLAPDEKDDEK
jgi:hypothetical protein